ncbi:Fatty acid desaturase 2 [Folsomia candida]|uniref:Fatty acid desaturase 2 n=1 Tax=Folsomia candida TaxID=158441 RepID=A0A226DLA5_FOLCA|nr:Fatty acid desaturase 2 [Folsomia candida]
MAPNANPPQIQFPGGDSLVKEILYEGHYYDVTKFIKKHPGGSIIEYYVEHGQDATHAVQQFHQRFSDKVRVILQSFTKRPATDIQVVLGAEKLKRHRALTEDFKTLYLELEKEGMFKPSYVHNIYRILEFMAIGYLGYLLLFSESYPIKFLGCLLLALAQGRTGWMMHEAGHFSLTGIPRVDRVLHAIICGVGAGMSSSCWAKGHNRHHAMPQRLHRDIDLDTLPLIAYNVAIVGEREKGSFLLRNQIYFYLTIDTLLGALGWQLYLHPKHVIKHRHYLQAISLLGHYYLLLYHCGFFPWLISTWALSIIMFVNFGLSHTFLPLSEEITHWVEYSLLHTADVEQRPWCDWWMGYLNYQIEHHLFPTMPHFRQPQIKDRVRALAAKHGLQYYVFSYKEALKRLFQNLRDVSQQLKES